MMKTTPPFVPSVEIELMEKAQKVYFKDLYESGDEDESTGKKKWHDGNSSGYDWNDFN